MEKVDFRYRVYDNILEITPVDGIKDNSIYTLKLSGILSSDRRHELPKKNVELATAMNPCYCTIDDVKALTETFDIPDSVILYLIRQASRQADYINQEPIDISEGIPFEVSKYVQLKATLDAFTRAYIDGTAESGIEGTLGKITFKNGSSFTSIKAMMDQFRRDLATWRDAIRGYKLAGRNKPAYAKHADKTLRPTFITDVVRGYSRNGNFGMYQIKRGI